METTVLVIDPETDGGVPMTCELQCVGDKFLVKKNGKKGFFIVLKLEDVEEALSKKVPSC